MTTVLHYEALKERQRSLRHDFPETMGLRVHRAISWIGRAEQCGNDEDARFIFLWISFNAAYADETDFQGTTIGERATFINFFNRLTQHDIKEKTIYTALWHRFSGPIRTLMNNHYIFHQFWQHQNGMEGFENWEETFQTSTRSFQQAFQDGNVSKVLRFVFDRLYVLRNQLVHGGATWNSRINRHQVRDGAAILAFLMPLFVQIMMANPHENWGRPFYPVVD